MHAVWTVAERHLEQRTPDDEPYMDIGEVKEAAASLYPEDTDLQETLLRISRSAVIPSQAANHGHVEDQQPPRQQAVPLGAEECWSGLLSLQGECVDGKSLLILLLL